MIINQLFNCNTFGVQCATIHIFFDFNSRMSHAAFTPEQKEILVQVFITFGNLSVTQLQEQIKQEEPWRNTYQADKLYAACEIKPVLLRQFFTKNLFL
ncbi:MAG: hypothetical protein Q8784_01910 [Vigna little leaf phytoplasma]|nr:hypothetical protein [Vigna little leaf phytoplasma]